MEYNFFTESAEYIEAWAPDARNLMIVPAEKREETLTKMSALPGYPVLYVTKRGSVSHATRFEILRRNDPHLFLLGGTDDISEWVAYSLSTLTKGAVYRIVQEIGRRIDSALVL